MVFLVIIDCDSVFHSWSFDIWRTYQKNKSCDKSQRICWCYGVTVNAWGSSKVFFRNWNV